MRGRYISVGVGSSKKKDPYQAGVAAAKEATKELEKKPTFSIVYTNTNFDQKEIARGINEVLGKNWVGASVDKQISNKYNYDKEAVVSVLSIYSPYLHFGVALEKNYIKNAEKSGINAIKKAMKSVKPDKYVDSYVQFTRVKKGDYSNVVRTPPHFIIAIAGSQIKKNGKYIAGGETDFLRGILKQTGPNIPVFGLGAGSDFDKFLDPGIKDGKNYQFANGEVYEKAGIVVFVVSNLHFDVDVLHGHKKTNDFAIVTKLSDDGHEILELNGKEPIEEYCRIIGVSKKDYLKSPETYALKRPFGLVALDGSTYIKEAFPNSDEKTLHCTYKLQEKMILNILEYDKNSSLKTMTHLVEDSKKRYPNKKIGIVVFSNCSSIRLLLEGEEAKSGQILAKKHKQIPFFGGYVFSEIGSTSKNSAQVHGETVTSLIIYDSLLTD